MSIVSIVKHGTVNQVSVEAVAKALESCQSGDMISRGDSVLVKPNLHGGEGTTSPQVMEAVCRWCFLQGAKEVIIGEGPFYGMKDPEPYFRAKGVERVAESTGAKWVIFHNHPYKTFEPKSERLPKTLGLTQFISDCDVLINLPVMKTHFNALVTLGMKNLKGCIRPEDKRSFHEMELNAAVAELSKFVRPAVTLLDAIVGLEGMGPASATPVDMGLLIASRDIVALDSIASYVMGIDPADVKTVRLGAKAGIGEMLLDKIEVVGSEPDSVRKAFELPFAALKRKYPAMAIANDGACSGCNMNFFAALDKIDLEGTQEKQKLEERIKTTTFVMGKSRPPGDDCLLIGKCTSKHWGCYPRVAGCPPSVGRIKERLTS